MSAGNDVGHSLPSFQPVERIGKGLFRFPQKDVVDARVVNQLVGHDGWVGAAHHGHDSGVDLADDLQAAHGGVVINAHHGDGGHVGVALGDDPAEGIPPIQSPEIDEVNLVPGMSGTGCQDSQAVAYPAGVHPLSNAIEPLAADARVHQADQHLPAPVRQGGRDDGSATPTLLKGHWFRNSHLLDGYGARPRAIYTPRVVGWGHLCVGFPRVPPPGRGTCVCVRIWCIKA